MSSTAFRETLDRALAAHRAGRLEDALAAYRAAQALRPDDPEAASLTGLALAQSGRAAEALPLLERAVGLAPADPGVRFNLAEGHLSAGSLDRALGVFREVLEIKPGFVAAWSRIGDLESRRGNDVAAAHAWSEALEVDPSAVHPTARLAELALRHGDPDKAVSLLEVGLSQHPTDERLLTVLCEVLAARREWGRLGTTARAWADARPESPDPWKQLSRAAFELGRMADAVQGYSNYLMRGRHDATDLAAYASLCLHALDFEAAEAALVAAEELDAAHPEVLARRALLHMYRGRFDAAADAAQRCLERQPDNVAVYTVLSRLRQGRLDDAQAERLRALAARADAPFDYRIPAAFAVAHDADARAEAEGEAGVAAAFAAYSQAHELALARDAVEDRRYDRAGQERRTRLLQELFPGPRSQLALPATPVPRRPVFIVGMPRSGTTLVEAVLGAHSRVHACGERGALPRILGNHLALAEEGRAPDATRLAQWAAAYLAEPAAPAERDVLTDKQKTLLAKFGDTRERYSKEGIALASNLLKEWATAKKETMLNVPLIVSAYVTESPVEKWNEYDVIKRAELFADLPMSTVWEVFFCISQLTAKLESAILKSTEKEAAAKLKRAILVLKAGSMLLQVKGIIWGWSQRVKRLYGKLLRR
jgi:tetratricopeptide (TPR) repeat protein